MNEKILSFLKSNGPSTNIDICKAIGLQSYVVDALLADMAGKTIKKSHKRLGSTRVYYLSGQEEKARMRVYKSLEEDQQGFLKKLEQKQVLDEADISIEQIEEWQDFMLPFSNQGRQAWHWFEMSEDAAKKLLKPASSPSSQALTLTRRSAPAPKESPKPASPKPESQKPKSQTQTSQKPASPKAGDSKSKGSADVVKADEKQDAAKVKVPEAGFSDRVALWLQSQGAKIIAQSEDKEGFEIETAMPTPLGEQAYLVVVKTPKKKKLNTEDIADAYSKAVSKKVPVILVSSTGFAKSAEKSWSKKYKNIITLIDGKNL